MSAMYAELRAAARHTGRASPAAQLPGEYLDAGRAAAECTDMRIWLAVLVVLTGCHLRAGLDAASRSSGPLHTMMSQSTVSRDDGVLNLPTANGRNYSLEAGFGTPTLTFNGLLAVHDVTSTSFTPGAGYLAATFGGNIRWSVLRWKGLSPTLAVGPGRMMLLDRTTGARTWGNGLRFAGGVQYRLGPISVYGDVYREIVAFGGGAAQGTTTLDGITLGLALQP
jgi:hypothetical protein